jgi:hypothetical protein
MRCSTILRQGKIGQCCSCPVDSSTSLTSPPTDERRPRDGRPYRIGRMGRGEARPMLLRLLREAPSAEVIDAAIAVADEECLILFGRLARMRPELDDTALAAARSPPAAAIAAAVRRSSPASGSTAVPLPQPEQDKPNRAFRHRL